MTDKEKLTKEYLELTSKFFEDSENVIFCRDINDAYEVMLKGNPKKKLDLTFEMCKAVIQRTEIPVGTFKDLLDLYLKKKSKQVPVAEIFRENI